MSAGKGQLPRGGGLLCSGRPHSVEPGAITSFRRACDNVYLASAVAARTSFTMSSHAADTVES
jgi:hypothetical protein